AQSCCSVFHDRINGGAQAVGDALLCFLDLLLAEGFSADGQLPATSRLALIAEDFSGQEPAAALRAFVGAADEILLLARVHAAHFRAVFWADHRSAPSGFAFGAGNGRPS